MVKFLAFCFILLSMIFLVSAQGNFNKYYEIDLNYNQRNFSLNSLEMEFSKEELKNLQGFHSAEVVRINSKNPDLVFFEVPNEILYDEVNENGTIVSGGKIELDKTNFTLYIPYYENASEVIIYDENMTEKLRIDVSMYSNQKTYKKIKNLEENVSQEKKPLENKTNKTQKEPENISKTLYENWEVLLVAVLIILIAILIKKLQKKE